LDAIEIAPLELGRGLNHLTKANIQSQIETLNLARRAAVACTNEKQWHRFGDTAYMMGVAAKSIATLLGISYWRANDPPQRIELPGGVVMIKVYVIAEKDGRKVMAHDACHARDDFLITQRLELTRQGLTPAAVELFLESDVEKKAEEGAISRAVGGWIGLQGLSFEELGRLGLKLGEVKGTDFRKGVATKTTPVAGLAALTQLPRGSKAAARGRVTEIKHMAGKKGPFCDIGIHDGSAGIWLRLWKSPPDWLAEGMTIFAPEITVGEYQGKAQYVCNDIEHSDTPEGDASNGRNHPGAARDAGPASGADDWEDARGPDAGSTTTEKPRLF